MLDPAGLEAKVRKVMEAHWRPDWGYSVPHASTYPWGWMWDSCFHAVIWAELGDERAVTELASVFSIQSASGFVPHMNYGPIPGRSVELWGRRGASTITQPPMFGHAVAVLHARRFDIEPIIGPATRGLHRLFEARRAPCGLLRILHPWESGADDLPRWARWQPDPFDRNAWAGTKVELVRSLRVEAGEAVANEAFDVCPAGFNALAVWNARQVAALTGDGLLAARADEVAEALDLRWDPEKVTWSDADPSGAPGSDVRTVDALLPALVSADPEQVRAAVAAALDPAQFGLPFGPAGVHPGEPSYSPQGYGRGATWPHLAYLLFWAARGAGLEREAAALAERLVAGATASDLAEYWDPRDGTGLGARPQSWTGLAAVVSAFAGGAGSLPPG